jgi:seryl-tRNA synthetase
VCDFVTSSGGILNVPITKKMLSHVSSARSRYRSYLEEERRKKMSQDQRVEDEVEEMKKIQKKRRILIGVCEQLGEDRDSCADEAERLMSAGGKSGPENSHQILAKSNAYRNKLKTKRLDLQNIQEELDAKSNELKHLADSNCVINLGDGVIEPF